MDGHMDSNGGMLPGQSLSHHPKLKPGESFYDDYDVYCTAVHFHFTTLHMAGASSYNHEPDAEKAKLFRFLLKHLEGFTWHNLNHETFGHLAVALANVFHTKFAQGQKFFSADEKRRAQKFYRKLRDVRFATMAGENGQVSVTGYDMPDPQMVSTPVSLPQVPHLSSPAAVHDASLVAFPANYHGGYLAASSDTGPELALEASRSTSPELALAASRSTSPELVSPASSPIVVYSDTEPTSPTSPSFCRPPADHPIFGDEGPMRGIAYKLKNKKKSWVANPDYAHLKKEAKRLGHNGIAVGSWWPAQSAAVFNGAHASWYSGISGTSHDGAYSVVRSGKPDLLDRDNGDVLLYSGSKTGNKALLASLENQLPVRVLRAADTGKDITNVWAPVVGIRYDGLYRVHAVHGQVDGDDNGNSHLRFELHRLGNQLEWATLMAIPDQEQRKIHGEMKEGY
ncbi:putative YDG/SRA domain-containing protein [Colletotrichum karsti]|uniref:YDG/SRA domain-containing protein n=1 Tax=Colletotrichum karsti TaxID=1095194 RepID=A0A9P6LJP3_9PEZI|nr:putative YDG/SRA domain-containing protein [Colletotrichum karsti]KAF9874772.1 putative YDG/SRA domain-containing protein [Colletotrichum karsti]